MTNRCFQEIARNVLKGGITTASVERIIPKNVSAVTQIGKRLSKWRSVCGAIERSPKERISVRIVLNGALEAARIPEMRGERHE